MYQIPSTSYMYHNPNPCNTVFFRITAVNQYGMKGFSNPYSVYGKTRYWSLILNLLIELRIFKGDCVVNKLATGSTLNF